jgi:hypothetical protein
MSPIGGPSGIDGPKGPGVPTEIDETSTAEASSAASAPTSAAGLEALAAEIAAGRLTPREAVDQLLEATVTPGMDATERAELKELLTDLVANDPYLAQLSGRT